MRGMDGEGGVRGGERLIGTVDCEGGRICGVGLRRSWQASKKETQQTMDTCSATGI